MRIAFVGKGGSGKTTFTALFTDYISKSDIPYLLIDGDINIHLPPLMGVSGEIQKKLHLSHPDNTAQIREYLRGDNSQINQLPHFRKTTPPAHGSHFIRIKDKKDPIITKYSIGGIPLLIVGSYSEEEIGTACYHNNLAILENILSHLDDRSGVVIVDMVAGTDAFSNTLHAQFDLLILVVEPTARSLGVYEQYKLLARAGGVYDHLRVVGNKIRNQADFEFISSRVPENQFLGVMHDSKYLRKADQNAIPLNSKYLESENIKVFTKIATELKNQNSSPAGRLKKLHSLHRAYVGQASIRERFGDLTNQIDESFDVDTYLEKYDQTNST